MWTNTDEVLAVTMITSPGTKAEGWICHWPRKNGNPAGWTVRFDITLPTGDRIRHWGEDPEHHLGHHRRFSGHRQAAQWLADTLQFRFPDAEILNWTCDFPERFSRKAA